MQTASPILSSVPDKLKSDCINQLDQLLSVVSSSELTAVDLLPKIADEHLATSLVLNKLTQIDDVSMACKGIDVIKSLGIILSFKSLACQVE